MGASLNRQLLRQAVPKNRPGWKIPEKVQDLPKPAGTAALIAASQWPGPITKRVKNGGEPAPAAKVGTNSWAGH